MTENNVTVIENTDQWNEFLSKENQLKLCLFTAPFCGICRQLKKQVPKMAKMEQWDGISFAICDTAQVPELKQSLSISGYPFWYIYYGVGYEGACMERFMTSRMDLVEENLHTAAIRAKLREP